MRLLPLLLLTGCPTPEDSAAPASTASLWPGEDRRPALEHPYFEAHPALQDLSLYASAVSGPVDGRPDQAHRGAFALGNGRAFGLMGLTDPLNTLHGMVGPVYEKGDRFFGDLAFSLEVDGALPETEGEWLARVRGSAVNVTRADAGELSLYTVDFAPRPAGVDDLDVPPAIVRTLLVHNRGEQAHDLAVQLTPYRDPGELGAYLAEGDDSGQWLAWLPWEGELDRDLHRIELGDLAGGASTTATVVLGFGTHGDDIAALEASLAATDPETWLEDTLAWWSGFSAQGVQLSIDDPRIEDLYDAQRVGVRVQQSAAGAVCPMSRYTGVWLRDTIGPVRFLLRAGLHEQATAALDYLFLCAVVDGDYSNHCSSGLEPDDMLEEPDWDALEPFSGRKAAEGPSYVPLAYAHYAAFTGDWQRVEQRWPYLRRGLLAQQISEEGLQPFSGDETYRIAMAAALGHDLEEAYEETAWSANSSFLMAAAARWMGQAAQRLDEAEDQAAFEALEALAHHALDEHYMLDEGYWSPLIWRDSGEPEPLPYEDVNLKALWAGSHGIDDQAATSNLAGLRAIAGHGDGTIQSILPEPYESFGVEVGMCTGMAPGYTLANLVAIGDPEAHLAFDALHRYADDGGQVDEYMVYDDMSALAPVYDASGLLGDFTARYRPWEGAIDADAMLLYLAGPIASDGEADMVLAPHLPTGRSSLSLDGLVAAGGAGDLALEHSVGALEARFVGTSPQPFSLQLDLPLPPGFGPLVAAAVEGEPAGELVTMPGGERRVRFAARRQEPGQETRYRVIGAR
jgi:hypothetical protein